MNGYYICMSMQIIQYRDKIRLVTVSAVRNGLRNAFYRIIVNILLYNN